MVEEAGEDESSGGDGSRREEGEEEGGHDDGLNARSGVAGGEGGESFDSGRGRAVSEERQEAVDSLSALIGHFHASQT